MTVTGIRLYLYSFNDNPALIRGLHCKACNKSMATAMDPELCNECMEVVNDYNRDLDPPEFDDGYDEEEEDDETL